MAHINDFLTTMVERGGSDLHLKVGTPPVARLNGRLMPIGKDRLGADDLKQMLYGILTDKQKSHFEATHELDFAYSVRGLARFRVNLCIQRSSIRAVMRIVPFEIKSFDDLMVPQKPLQYLCNLNRGLVLVTGPTGSGKSTTLAAMIDYINNRKNLHVVTVEDPVEFLYRDNKCIISQREVGTDTDSFGSALRAAFRQDPDVILVGEMRDTETIATALTAAETGHLVFSTLHTTDAPQTIDRIIDVFPPHQQSQIRIQLSVALQGVVSQRLLPRADGKGRVPAIEILIATPTVRKIILEHGDATRIYEAIMQGQFYGMCTMNMSLVKHYQEGLITLDEALATTGNPDEFKLNLKGIYAGSGTSDSQEDIFGPMDSAKGGLGAGGKKPGPGLVKPPGDKPPPDKNPPDKPPAGGAAPPKKPEFGMGDPKFNV